jgi:hypothetical protein
MSKSPYEPWLLNERTAKVLGLPLIALTPTAQLIANRQEWLWFDLATHLAIWQGPTTRYGFSVVSLAAALDRIERRAMG